MSGGRRLGRWTRRGLLVLALLLALLVALRVAIPIALPSVVDRLVAEQDLAVAWDDIEILLRRGNIELEGLTISSRAPDAEPLVEIDYLRVELGLFESMRGPFVIRRAYIDGLHVELERRADGTSPLIDRIASLVSSFAPKVPRPAPKPTKPLELGLPFELRAAGLQRLSLHWKDETLDPPVDVTVTGGLSLLDLGSREQKTRFQVVLAAQGGLDLLHLSGEGASGGRELGLDLGLELAGFRPEFLAGVLAQVGLEPNANRIDASLQLHVQTEAPKASGTPGAPGSALAVDVEVEDLTWLADDETVARIPTLRAHASELSARGLRGVVAEVDHLGFVTSFEGEGPVFLGLGLSKGGPPPAAPAAPADPEPGGGWPMTFEDVSIQNATLTVHDRTRFPEVDYDLRLDQLDLANVVLGEEGSTETASIELRARAPGLFDSLSISGTRKQERGERELVAKVALEGLGLDALKGRLEASNLMTTLESGTLDFDLFSKRAKDAEGRDSISFGVEQLRYAGQTPLLELDRVALEEVVYDRTRSFLRVGHVGLSGTRLTASLDPQGSLMALGLQTRPRAKSEPASRGQTLAEAVSTLTGAVLPRRETMQAIANVLLPHENAHLELGGLDWDGGSVALVDQGEFGEFGFEISDLGAKVGDCVIAADAEGQELEASVWLRSPGYFDEITLDTSATYGASPIEIDARLGLAVENLEQSWLEPFLKVNGLEATFGRARFGAELSSRVTVVGDEVDLTTSVTDVFLQGSEGPLAGLDAITLKGVHFDEAGLDLGEIEVLGPSLRAKRNTDGRLELLGVRPVAAAPVEGTTPTPMPPPQLESPPAPPSDAGSVAREEPPAEPEAQVSSVQLPHFVLRDGSFAWSDQQLGVETNVGLQVELTDTTLQGNALAGQCVVDVNADGQQHLRVEGEVDLEGEGLHVAGTLAADQITDGRFQAYLPPGVAIALDAGQASLGFEVELGRAEAGGLAGMAAVRDLKLTGPDGALHAALGEARVEVARADFEEGQLLIDALSVRGVDTRVTIGADGAVQALGMAFSSPPEDEKPAEDGEPVEAEAEEGVQVASTNAASGAGPRLETIRVETLDLEVTRLEIADERRPLSVPAELGGRLTNEGGLDVLTPVSEEADPLQLAFRGFARPLIESAEIDVTYTPDLLRPSATADIRLGGFDWPSLLRLVPELEGTLDPSGVVASKFDMRVEAGLEVGRRGGDFGLVGNIKDAHFRNEAGESVGGFDLIHVDVPEIDLATGDIHVRTLGLLSPRGRTILREKEIEVAGLVIRTGAAQPAAAEPGAAEPGADGAPGARAPAAAGETAEATKAAPGAGTGVASKEVARSEPREGEPQGSGEGGGGEVLIDEATISGIDLTIVDAVTDPPTSIPIDDLYVEVRGISSRALDLSRPIRFEAYTNAGVAERADQKMDAPTMEELTIDGWLELVPKPTGWFRIQLVGLELLPFKDRAAQSGVRIKDGTLDTTVRATLKKEKLAVESRSVFTDLAMSEKENGPIQRTLKLPVPLNVAIVILQNSNGELIIPLSFTMNASQISRSEMFLTVTTTLSKVLVAAIAKSPFRILNTTGQIVGLSDKEKRKPPRIEAIEFAPGDATLREPQRAVIEKLRKVLAKGEATVVVTHESGTGDRALVVERATPTHEEVAELVERLRQSRRDIAHEVTLAMARGRTRMATGNEEGWREASTEVSELLGEYERFGQALDDMSQLLRTDADQHRAHREAQLLAQLGWLRMDSTYSALVEGLPPEIVSNVLVRRPLARDQRETEGGAVVITVREGR